MKAIHKTLVTCLHRKGENTRNSGRLCWLAQIRWGKIRRVSSHGSLLVAISAFTTSWRLLVYPGAASKPQRRGGPAPFDFIAATSSSPAYATGVSMEFEPAGLSHTTGPDCPPNAGLRRFWRVFYSPETQRKIIRSAIDYYPKFEPGAAAADWARWTAEAVRFFIPTFKSEDFKEEKEWRPTFTPAPGSPAKPSYRVARGMLIPYYSLNELARQLGRRPATPAGPRADRSRTEQTAKCSERHPTFRDHPWSIAREDADKRRPG